MRASVLWIVVTISLFASLGTVASLGQDKPSEPTVEEIVSRHEATWAKLGRARFDLETQNQFVRMATGVRLDFSGKRVTETNLHEVQTHVKGAMYLDGERSSARFQVSDHRVVNEETMAVLPEREKEETRELHDQGLLTSISPKRVLIEKPTAPYPKSSAFILGQGISIAMMAVQVSLRDWVAEAHPAVALSKNAAGETCYVLTGDFRTNITPTQDPAYRTDKVTITLNADRGCLIERIEFACETQEHRLSTKSTKWEVMAWHRLENDLSFPAQVEWGTECWDDPHKDWLKATIAKVQLNPPDMAKQFEYSVAEGAVVYDRTARPGTSAVSIWGADGKPSKSYASVDDYHRDIRAVEMQKLAESQEKNVAKMFPGCTVKVTRQEEKDDFHTIVYDESGAALREFKGNEELAIFEGIREMIRVALGVGEQETRQR